MNTHEPLVLEFKICPACNVDKSISDFHSKGSRRENICKFCSNAKKKKRRIQKQFKERRRKQTGHTLHLGAVMIAGNLNEQLIEDFGRAYGNLILEVYNENK